MTSVKKSLVRLSIVPYFLFPVLYIIKWILLGISFSKLGDRTALTLLLAGFVGSLPFYITIGLLFSFLCLAMRYLYLGIKQGIKKCTYYLPGFSYILLALWPFSYSYLERSENFFSALSPDQLDFSQPTFQMNNIIFFWTVFGLLWVVNPIILTLSGPNEE